MEKYIKINHIGLLRHNRRISFALPKLKDNEYFQDIYLSDNDNIQLAKIIDNQNVSYNIDYFLIQLNGTLENKINDCLQLIVDIKDKKNENQDVNIECYVLIESDKFDMIRKKELYLQSKSDNEYVYVLYKSNRGNAEYKISVEVDLKKELEYLLKDKLNDKYLWYVDMLVFTKNVHVKKQVETLFNVSKFTSYICNIKYYERYGVWEHLVKFVL